MIYALCLTLSLMGYLMASTGAVQLRLSMLRNTAKPEQAHKAAQEATYGCFLLGLGLTAFVAMVAALVGKTVTVPLLFFAASPTLLFGWYFVVTLVKALSTRPRAVAESTTESTEVTEPAISIVCIKAEADGSYSYVYPN